MEYTHLYAIICSFVLVCRVIAYETINNGTLGPPSIEDVINRISVLESFILPLPADQLDQLIHETVTRYVPINAQSELCRQHSLLVVEAFHQRHLWALKMLDAGTKMMSGVLDGHLQDFGNFEQCVNIIQPDNLFNGQLCVVQTAGLLDQNIQQTIIPTDITFSICVPSSCTVEDVATHVDTVLAQVNASTMYSFVKNSGVEVDFIDKFLTCSAHSQPGFRLEDYIALSILLSIILAAVIFSVFESCVGFKSGFSSISLRHSFASLMDTRAPANEISCLNGLRVISIILVINYHQLFNMILLTPTYRRDSLNQEFYSVTVRMVECSAVLLDVFFLMGGIVTSYTFYQKKDKQIQVNIVKSGLNRYFRLTPALAVIVLFYATLLTHLSSGPIWPWVREGSEQTCRDYWWTRILQVGNYVCPVGSDCSCVGVSWYVACDFQLYILATLLLILHSKHPKIGTALMALSFLGPIIYLVAKSYNEQLFILSVFSEINMRPVDESPTDYTGFHLRACFYAMGLALGYILFTVKQNKNKIQPPMLWMTVGWVTAALEITIYIVLSLIVFHPDHTFRPWFDPLFNGLAKPLTCLAIAWVIFACSLGYGGFINRFLSWSAFRPLAKLVYGVFLVHEIMSQLHMFSVRVVQSFSHIELLYLTCSDTIMSFFLAMLLYLFVEIPCFQLAAYFLADKKPNLKTTQQTCPPSIVTK